MSPKTTPKDFFLHLAAVVALYASAIALINLCFSIVDYYNPDALAASAGWRISASSIAWPVSMLVVLVPVLYVLEWLIGRDLIKSPEKKEIWIRRWRIYLTLFLAGATIIGDLITLINTYLNGEITSRFVYKIIIVLLVAGVIFAYYLLARVVESLKAKNWRKALAWLGIIVVLIGIVGGFTVVGSPTKQRELRFDSQRVSDLTNIQWQVINYWQAKRMLPAALSDLNDPLTNFTVPLDPETGTSYEYAIINAAASNGNAPVTSNANPSFSLCATFDLTSSANPSNVNAMSYPVQPAGAVNPSTDSWTHAAGQVCFDRSIDPSRYSPVIKTSPI
jgi:MFS family permease